MGQHACGNMNAMFHRFVVATLLSRPWQTAGCVASSALACAALETAAGIYIGIGPNPSLQRLMIGLWTSGLLLCVAAIAFLVLAIEQYVEVRERTQDYGILRVLGASTRDFLSLLAIEALFISIFGAVFGIVLTLAAKGLVGMAFSRYLALSIRWVFWPAALFTSLSALMLGSGVGARKAIPDGVEEALSYRK